MGEILEFLCGIVFGWLEIQAQVHSTYREPSLVNPRRFQTLSGNEPVADETPSLLAFAFPYIRLKKK